MIGIIKIHVKCAVAELGLGGPCKHFRGEYLRQNLKKKTNNFVFLT
jgi:hypothetical protein